MLSGLPSYEHFLFVDDFNTFYKNKAYKKVFKNHVLNILRSLPLHELPVHHLQAPLFMLF